MVFLVALAGIVLVILGLVHVIAVSLGLGLGLIAVLTVQLLSAGPAFWAAGPRA